MPPLNGWSLNILVTLLGTGFKFLQTMEIEAPHIN